MPNGAFIWYELMTSDPTAAEAFYTAVIGWNAKDAGMPGMAYTIFRAGETGAAGMMALPEEARQMGAQPAWMGYVLVDDVDGFVGKVTGAGGAMHRPPADIPGVGRFAVMGDPQGAAFMLFAPHGSPPGAPPPPDTPGLVGWRQLSTSDHAAAFDFYAGLFGWTKAGAVDMGQMGTYQIFAIDGAQAGGMMNQAPGTARPHWLYFFNVAGIEAAAERIASSGGKVLHGPVEVPGGLWVVDGLDPQGAMFALVGPRA